MFDKNIQIPNMLNRLIEICFVICIPATIVCTAVLTAFNADSVYTRGFEKYGISQKTGISDSELLKVTNEIQNYFNSNKELLDTKTVIYGETKPLFNQREIHHMKDVKSLVRGIYWILIISAAYICIVSILRLTPTTITLSIAKLVLYGSLSTIAIICLFGLLALLEFESLFLLFHKISFSNDLWILDPMTDYLIIMFPTGFWFDATLLIATTTICIAGITTTLSAGVLMCRRWITMDNKNQLPNG